MTTEYVPNLEPSVLATVAEELARKEETQKHHYHLLNELQAMARELPGKFQQRLPYDLLSSLASALLDSTVYEIVRSLKEVQQLEERNLFTQRTKLINENKAAKQELMQKHREAIQNCQSKPHNLPYVQTQCEREAEAADRRGEEEAKRKDMKMILELDQKVMDQQTTLEKAGVPGFYVTNNPQEVRLQMYLLDFITRMGQKEAAQGMQPH